METIPLWFGRVAITAFFAVAFLQSAADKLLDARGNLDYLTGHFANSPLRNHVLSLFWAITLLEAVAGVLCGLGTFQLLFGLGKALALWGLVFSTVALFCLFVGQRLAKDYGGAVVLASYYTVAILGLVLVGLRVP